MSVGNEQPEAPQMTAASVDPLELSHRRPEWSASQPMTRAQKRVTVALLLAVVTDPAGKESEIVF